MEEFDSLQSSLDKGLFELTKLWREIGIDNVTANDRKKTVNFQFKNILDRMRYISSDVVPTTAQLEQLKDHNKRIEDESHQGRMFHRTEGIGFVTLLAMEIYMKEQV